MYAHTTCFTYRQTPETERLDEETHAAANIWKSEPTDYRGDPQQLHLIANISTLIPLLDHRAGAPWHDPKRKPSLNGPLKNRVWDYRDDCGCQIKHLINRVEGIGFVFSEQGGPSDDSLTDVKWVSTDEVLLCKYGSAITGTMIMKMVSGCFVSIQLITSKWLFPFDSWFCLFRLGNDLEKLYYLYVGSLLHIITNINTKNLMDFIIIEINHRWLIPMR